MSASTFEFNFIKPCSFLYTIIKAILKGIRSLLLSLMFVQVYKTQLD